MLRLTKLFLLLGTGVLLASCFGNKEEVAYTGNWYSAPIYDMNLDNYGAAKFSELTGGIIEVEIETDSISDSDTELVLTAGSFLNPGEEIASLSVLDAKTGYFKFRIPKTVMVWGQQATSAVHIKMKRAGVFVSGIDFATLSIQLISPEYPMYNAFDQQRGHYEFYVRFNGKSILKINLGAINPGFYHPTSIYQDTYQAGGEEFIKLNSLNGTTGVSVTALDFDVNGNDFFYNNFDALNFHIKSVVSETDSQVIAWGNIE